MPTNESIESDYEFAISDISRTSKTSAYISNCTPKEEVAERCSVKKVFLETLQNLQENTCARISFLIKFRPATLLKKRLWHRCFRLNFAKFLRTPFLTEYLWSLLLHQEIYFSVRKTNRLLNDFLLSPYQMKTQTKIQVLQENMDQKKILKVFDRFAQSYHSFQRVHSVLPPPPPGIGGE